MSVMHWAIEQASDRKTKWVSDDQEEERYSIMQYASLAGYRIYWRQNGRPFRYLWTEDTLEEAKQFCELRGWMEPVS